MRVSTKSHRVGALFLACTAGMGLVIALARAHAGGPDFGPDDDEIRQAQRFAATLRQADGVPRALRALCRAPLATGLRHDVAFSVLVERAVGAMPRLLDAIAAGDRPDATEHEEVWSCSEEARKIVVAAVCTGRAWDRYEVERRRDDQIAIAQAAAQRALVGFLAKPGPRRRAALIATHDSDTESCDGSTEVLRRASPALIKLLSSKADGRDALQLLASRRADPVPAAIPSIRPYLADRTSLPWAVLALVRMGEDMSPQVAPLIDLLDGPDADLALSALQAIGRRAQTALPRLVLLARQTAASCTNGDRAAQLVETIVGVAARADAGVATQALGLLLPCGPSRIAAANALVQYGSTGRTVLLRYVLDDEQPVQARLHVATAVQSGGVPLDRAEREMIRLLQAKAARRAGPPPAQVQMRVPERDPTSTASEELDFCRAEAGMPRIRMSGVTAAQAASLGSCLANYACGPSRSTLTRTLHRCCSEAFGAQLPPFCHP